MNNEYGRLSCVRTRRQWLQQSALGFGSVALAGLCAEQADGGALAPRAPHFPPRAQRVIFLFMQGGQSQMDLFDPKPELNRRHGEMQGKSRLTGATHPFARYGQAGLEMSSLLPNLGRHADDLCLVRSMYTDSRNHSNAMLFFHTGSQNFVRPSIGSWVTYGLGTENDSLPGFITIRPTRGHGSRVHSSAFLPAIHQASALGDSGVPMKKATFRNLSNPHWTDDQQQRQLALTQSLNERFRYNTASTPEMEGLIQSYELAFRMQTESPKLFDLADEPQHALDAYGVDRKATDEVGRMCLLARRFAEAGVRYIQVNHAGWDHHSSISSALERSCGAADGPIGALLSDLKDRGMLEDTLVVSSGEFGRTATGEGDRYKAGRGHNSAGFSIWMAGGGVRGGLEYGVTDDLGVKAVENRVHVHDLHATLLHLLGLDHESLTYRYAGRDFRLTDVYGNVLTDILA
jgi:hypothetical protein